MPEEPLIKGRRQYGLVLPISAKTSTEDKNRRRPVQGFSLSKVKKTNVLGSSADSSSDEDSHQNPVLGATSRTSTNAVLNKKTLESVQQALDEDPTVFDYDAVYDDLKQAQELAKKRRTTREQQDTADGEETSSAVRQSKYISGLKRASEKRKLELERAEERRVQRERELEGELFGDKEKFVTQAYLDRQKELQRLEDEERRKETLSTGNSGQFYQGLLDNTLALRGPVALSEQDKAQLSFEKERLQKTKEKLLCLEVGSGSQGEKEEVLKEALERGAVQLNDSGELVDKRQLLQGGLNFTQKALIQKEMEEQALIEAREAREKALQEKKDKEALLRAEQERRRVLREQQAKRREDLELQRRTVEEEAVQDESKRRLDLEKASQSLVSTDSISDAKARYLARKKRKQMGDDS